MYPWLASEWHKIGIALIALERIWERTEPIWRRLELFERRTEERTKHMNILEIPQFVKDVVQLTNDLKAAEAILAPQFPQLVADITKIKVDGEKLLGIQEPPPVAKAA